MYNHRYFTETYDGCDKCDKCDKCDPVEERSVGLSRADLLKVLLPKLNDLFFPNSDSQEKSE